MAVLLGNKPDEPSFKLKLEPSRLLFSYVLCEPCSVELRLTNQTTDRHAVKIKVTDNVVFRVKPPLFFVHAGQTVKVKVTYNSQAQPENSRHYLAIYHMKSDELYKNPRQVWTPNSKIEGVARIACSFEANKDAPTENITKQVEPSQNLTTAQK